MIIHDFDEKEFNDLISKDKVILDFYATWCGPCKMMSKVLEEYNNEEVKIIKINVDKHENIAKKYGVMTIPTLILYENGKEIDQCQNHQPILPWKQVHVAEQEHDDKTHKRQIERGEYQTDDPGGIDNTFLSAYHDYFTFSTLQ